MPTVTQAQLVGANFSAVAGAGQRFQVWTGARQNQESVMVVWDSTSEKLYPVPDGLVDIPTIRALYTFGVLIAQLINASTLSAGNKTAGITALQDCVPDINIPA